MMSTFPTTEDFLAEPNVAILATVDRKGRPHAAPVWYLYEAGSLVISTGRGSQKHKNVEANPAVTIVIDRRTLPYFALMVSGTAEVGAPLDDQKRLEMAVRYLGGELGQRYVERTAGSDSITMRVKPRKTVVFEGRAGRTE
jgi:PPOX class probable F420-dependent enzyme